MVSGNLDEARLRQHRDQPVERPHLVVRRAADDQHRQVEPGDLGRGRVDKGVEDTEQCLRVGTGGLEERLRHELLVAVLEAAEVGQHAAEEARAPPGVNHAFVAETGEHRPPRPGSDPARQHPHRRPRAERVAAEIIVGQAEMRDQRLGVHRQRVGRIGGGIVWRGAFAMCAQVGHDHPEPGIDQLRRGAVFDPVGVGVGEEAVDQHHRPSLAHLPPRDRCAVEALECLSLHSRGDAGLLAAAKPFRIAHTAIAEPHYAIREPRNI